MGTIWSREYGWCCEGRDPNCMWNNAEIRVETRGFIRYRWGKIWDDLHGHFADSDFWDYDWDSDNSW